MGALDGLLVLDLTRLLPGAVATQYLADQGAEVIKIEQPVTGDYARTLSPAVFARTNRGKKSVVLDLKSEFGKQTLQAMALKADIFLEGFRPGVMDRLGLGSGTLRAANPRLIYVSLTGYGQGGPDALLAGHDINYMALGGLLGLNCGSNGVPVIPGSQIGDLVGGSMQAVAGIMLALVERHSTGIGRVVDVSMTAGVASLLPIPLAELEFAGHDPRPGHGMLTGRHACYQVYRARDDRWLAVGALEPKFWAELCRRLGCAELIAAQFDQEAQPALKARLGAIFATRDAGDWFAELRAFDCCVTLVRRVSEVAAAGASSNDRRPVPEIGEHSAELLAKYAGVDKGAIP